MRKYQSAYGTHGKENQNTSFCPLHPQKELSQASRKKLVNKIGAALVLTDIRSPQPHVVFFNWIYFYFFTCIMGKTITSAS